MDLEIYNSKFVLPEKIVARPSTTNPKPAVSTGKIIRRDDRNVRGIGHAHLFRKNDFLGKYD